MSETNTTSLLTGNPRTPLFKPSIEYGAIVGLIGVGLSLALYYAGVDQESWLYRIISWGVMITMMFWFTGQYRNKKNNGFMTFGQGVGLNTLVGVWSGIIVAIYMLLFFNYIAPEAMDKIHEAQYNAIMEQGMSADQADQAMAMTSKFTSPLVFAIGALIGSPIMYCLIGLVVSAIMKREDGKS